MAWKSSSPCVLAYCTAVLLPDSLRLHHSSLSGAFLMLGRIKAAGEHKWLLCDWNAILHNKRKRQGRGCRPRSGIRGDRRYYRGEQVGVCVLPQGVSLKANTMAIIGSDLIRWREEPTRRIPSADTWGCTVGADLSGPVPGWPSIHPCFVRPATVDRLQGGEEKDRYWENEEGGMTCGGEKKKKTSTQPRRSEFHFTAQELNQKSWLKSNTSVSVPTLNEGERSSLCRHCCPSLRLFSLLEKNCSALY